MRSPLFVVVDLVEKDWAGRSGGVGGSFCFCMYPSIDALVLPAAVRAGLTCLFACPACILPGWLTCWRAGWRAGGQAPVASIIPKKNRPGDLLWPSFMGRGGPHAKQALLYDSSDCPSLHAHPNALEPTCPCARSPPRCKLPPCRSWLPAQVRQRRQRGAGAGAEQHAQRRRPRRPPHLPQPDQGRGAGLGRGPGLGAGGLDQCSWVAGGYFVGGCACRGYAVGWSG
jgi:hypothetical protein